MPWPELPGHHPMMAAWEGGRNARGQQHANSTSLANFSIDPFAGISCAGMHQLVIFASTLCVFAVDIHAYSLYALHTAGCVRKPVHDSRAGIVSNTNGVHSLLGKHAGSAPRFATVRYSEAGLCGACSIAGMVACNAARHEDSCCFPTPNIAIHQSLLRLVCAEPADTSTPDWVSPG